jgi:LPS-assembly lipoprotein
MRERPSGVETGRHADRTCEPAIRSRRGRLLAALLLGGSSKLGPRLRGDDESAIRSRRGRLLAGLALSGGLVACGFRLRGTQALPFDSVFVEAAAGSAVGRELARSIAAGTSTRVSTDRATAAAVLVVVSETRERDVLSVNAQGRAREYRGRLRVVVRVHDGKGRELLGPTPVATTRDLAVSEGQMLAREYEEEQLFQDMTIDIAQQVLRRLSALKA